MISVVITVYNAEKYLETCIESVQKQTNHDWELYLVDDGSTDTSGQICDQYADKDKRVNTLIRAALRYNSMDAGVADEICRILDEKGTDNMQQVYLSFIQRMPGTVAERQAIYKVIKPYFSVLNNI